MTQDTEKLAVCPFCGGEGVPNDIGAAGQEDWCRRYTATCRECCCNCGWHDTEAEAIAAWNQRTVSDRFLLLVPGEVQARIAALSSDTALQHEGGSDEGTAYVQAYMEGKCVGMRLMHERGGSGDAVRDLLREARDAMQPHAGGTWGQFGDLIARIDAALSASSGDNTVGVGGWRDIASAPRDGTWFLAMQDRDIYPCQWHTEEPDEGPPSEGWFDLFNRSFEAPTEWQPLPEANSKSAASPTGEVGDE
jgi:hypothetical protein